MSETYKRSYKAYPAWNYEEELDDLNKASEQGWQLVKGGLFSSKFKKNTQIQYRYQLDYQKVEDMGRYIETFREQGWEYINSTFNGWHYFRKLYDASQPDEAYEIFTDRESLQEMNNRWARFALIIGSILCLFALVCAVRLYRRPQLPRLFQLLTLLIEGVVLLRGGLIMRNPESGSRRRGGSTFLTVFFTAIILGCTAILVSLELRPYLTSEQNAGSIEEPIIDNRWVSFEVHYPDNYYLDLEFNADKPLTFAVVNEAGEPVYDRTETSFQEKDIRIKLPRGEYWFSMSCESGFEIKCSIE